jgi:hypothetical protein
MNAVLTRVALLGACVCLPACDGLVVVISTAPSPLQPGSATVTVAHVTGGPIVVGRLISGAVTKPCGGVDYQFTPPRGGMLVLAVDWDRSLGALNVLFANNMLPRPGTAPPFTARVPVQAGQSYTIQVTDATAQAGSTVNVPFTVTASLE